MEYETRVMKTFCLKIKLTVDLGVLMNDLFDVCRNLCHDQYLFLNVDSFWKVKNWLEIDVDNDKVGEHYE